jgi:hypothetical protein
MITAWSAEVYRADPVGQHAHPLALEAAQDRPRSVRPERTGRHARLARQRLADRRPKVAGQFLAGNHRGAGQHIGFAKPIGRGDDDRRRLLRGLVLRLLALGGRRRCAIGIRERRNRQQNERGGQEKDATHQDSTF